MTIATPFFTSCEKWFDVTPRSQVKNDELFKDEYGFKTALFGIYTSMAQPTLYGQDLSMGFVDVLAQYYTISSSSHNAYKQSIYEYSDVTIENKTENIWKYMYRTIINCNNLLVNLNGKEALFAENNFRLIRGEVLGLRAFLHFDLLRMYAPSFAVGNKEAAIPYVDRVERTPFPQLTNEEVVKRVLDDCKKALEDLYVSDPVIKEGFLQNNPNEFLNFRNERMNYFAVKALMARVYLWIGNRVEAEKISTELKGFLSKIGSTKDIFAIYTDKLTTGSDIYFSVESSEYSKLIVSQDARDEIYETATVGAYDRRVLDWIILDPSTLQGATAKYMLAKYSNLPSRSSAIPLIRMSEVYYIHAESTDDKTEAFNDLNKIRSSFQIPINANLTEENSKLENEIYKEYRKMFIGEGQLFYYFKRKDVSSIPNAGMIKNPREVFCFPIPLGEYEFGSMIKK